MNVYLPPIGPRAGGVRGTTSVGRRGGRVEQPRCLGYIGVNLVTMGKALHAMLGWEVTTAAWIVAGICAIYVTAGGQTSVIMTDLLQGLLLLVAGIFLLVIGIAALGGLGDFWHALPQELRAPLRPCNHPPEFNFVGVFWQDGG